LPDSDLLATRLAPLRRIACASPQYLKESGCPEKPVDLLNHNCLTLSTTRSATGWWCFPNTNQGKPLPVLGRFRSDDTESLVTAAVAGLGVAHLASWLVHGKLASGELVRLFPSLVSTTATSDLQSSAIHAVRLKGRSHAAKAQLFIAHLKQTFGEIPYWDKDFS
jgi:DNA-binding transcriptional LysR family regulator